MNDWRDHILEKLTPGIKLTLIADPDGLLAEEKLAEEIRRRGFEILVFEDSLTFRFSYESAYRTRWDAGDNSPELLVCSQKDDFSTLPWDLHMRGRKLQFHLKDLFPSLSYPAVRELDRSDLDALYRAMKQHHPENMGENATKDFILRHVFGIVPENIRHPEDLLPVLLRQHFRKQTMPEGIVKRWIQILRQNPVFQDWNLEQIVPDSNAFFRFLQERWPLFLDMQVQETAELRESADSHLEFTGPAALPFSHADIRVYIDSLFLEGLLRPVSHIHAHRFRDSWISAGLKPDSGELRIKRVEKIMERAASCIPEAAARHQEWIKFLPLWSELCIEYHALASFPSDSSSFPAGAEEKFQSLQHRADTAFSFWLSQRYAALCNLPLPPVMVHHIPRMMARMMESSEKIKTALLVIDGMGFDQWILVRGELQKQIPGLVFSESAVFAWIPTVTSVSRQALFSASPPAFFPSCIHSTAKEPVLWRKFWENQGISPSRIAYLKTVEEMDRAELEEQLFSPKIRVAGLVINKIDKIMHGMELGTAGMHSQTRQWASQGYLAELIANLKAHDFQIVITSDHGNVEALGCGNPSEGALADMRGERVRLYPDPILRTKVVRDFGNGIAWEPAGLPEHFFPLIAPGRTAFVRKGKKTVTHGGISPEEVMVPFVRL